MSKHNKVNKTNYDQRGRLTPDELARERAADSRGRGTAPVQRAGETGDGDARRTGVHPGSNRARRRRVTTSP